MWPTGTRMTAHCTAGLSQWTWVPVEGEPRNVEGTTFVQPGSGAFVTASSASSAANVPHISPPPKPSNPLPPGWNWSWEPLRHDSPDESCQCGIYVVAKPEDTLGYLKSHGVIVEIALWGKVITAHKGARGQYAYPQKLLVPGKILPEVKATAQLYRLVIDVLDLEGTQPNPPIAPAVIQTAPGALLNAAQQKQERRFRAMLDAAFKRA